MCELHFLVLAHLISLDNNLHFANIFFAVLPAIKAFWKEALIWVKQVGPTCIVQRLLSKTFKACYNPETDTTRPKRTNIVKHRHSISRTLASHHLQKYADKRGFMVSFHSNAVGQKAVSFRKFYRTYNVECSCWNLKITFKDSFIIMLALPKCFYYQKLQHYFTGITVVTKLERL